MASDGLPSFLLSCMVAMLLCAAKCQSDLSPSGVHVCHRTTIHSIALQESYTISRRKKTTTQCNLWWRCTAYRTVYVVAYRQVFKTVYRISYNCCAGWSQHGTECTVPICSPACINGTCASPDSCTCNADYYGPRCSKRCQCQNNATCDSRTGSCHCSTDWTGLHCDIPSVTVLASNAVSLVCVGASSSKTTPNGQMPHLISTTSLTAAFTPQPALTTALKTSSVTSHTTIKPVGFCQKEKTGKVKLKGLFSWNVTLTGTVARSHCPYGPRGAWAYRSCAFGENVHFWKIPDSSECSFASNKTNILNSLSETKVNDSNAVQVMDTLKNMINDNEKGELSDVDLSKTAEIIEKLVNVRGKLDELGEDIVGVVDTIMQVNETALAISQQESNTSTKLLKAISNLAENLPLLPNETSRVLESNNIVIQTSRVEVESFRGMSFDGNEESNQPQARITLPDTMFEGAKAGDTRAGKDTQLGFTLYRSNVLFQMIPGLRSKTTNYDGVVVNSLTISASVKGMKITKLENHVEIQLFLLDEDGGGTSTCVYWDFDAAGGRGNWSTLGCSIQAVSKQSSHVTCQCTHLTSFAVLLSPNSGNTENMEKLDSHDKVLSVISYVGSAISVIGVFLTLLTYLLFKPLRKSHVQRFLMSLCLSLMLLLIVFIAGAERRGGVVGCRCVAVLLHYFLLTSMAWMSMEAYSMYVCLVKVAVSHSSSLFMVCSFLAWGLPALIVAITAGVASKHYGTNQTCVLTGVAFYAAQLAPALLCVLYNLVVFVLVMINLSRGSMATRAQRTTIKQRLRIAATLMGLLGLTWVFGALSVEGAQRVFEYLFCVFTTLQGFFIFYFHCLRQREVRQHWKWFIKGRGMRGWREKSMKSKTLTTQTRVRKAERSLGTKTSTETVQHGIDGPGTALNRDIHVKAKPSKDMPVRLLRFSKVLENQ